MFFLFQRYRDIFASNIHIHLDNTFKFFSYTGVLCLRNSFESLFKKKTTAKQTNIKNQKKKLIHFLISDIRIIDIKKSFSAIRKYLRNIKTAPRCHKEIHWADVGCC